MNRLGLPAALRTCLTTTNIIDSTHSGIRQRTRRVTNWKNGEMALRWSAVAFVETEKNYRRITGYEHLWMLKAHLIATTTTLQRCRRSDNLCSPLPLTFYCRWDTLPTS